MSVAATCTRCRDVCPTGAIDLDGMRTSVRVQLDHCIDCGLCTAECPNDAFEGPFDLQDVLPRLSGDVVCGQDGLPCIGALSTEDLIGMALRGQALRLIDGACPSRDPGHARAEARVLEARRFLEALGFDTSLSFVPAPDLPPAHADVEPMAEPSEEETPPNGRRSFLTSVLPSIETSATPMLQAPDRLDRTRMQKPTARRLRLLDAWPPSAQVKTQVKTKTLPISAIGFFSSKDLDADRCTACSICLNVCPTGALSGTRGLKEIHFETSRCTKCHLCHDVCEPDAIRLANEVSIGDFLDFSPHLLARISMAQCSECGARYKRDLGREGMCPRCSELEAEARELSGFDP